MNYSKRLVIILALALAGALVLAGSGWATNQGSGPAASPVAQGQQLCTGGPNGTCRLVPKAPARQDCPGYGAGPGKKVKASQGAKQGNQPETQAKPQATGK
jgi:hypothetical protein